MIRLNKEQRVADIIGKLRAEISELQDQLAEQESFLKQAGDGVYEGMLYRVNVGTSDRRTTAWKTIAEKLGASTRIIKANTSSVSVTSLRVYAKLADKKAA
jgi:hypothetical protein